MLEGPFLHTERVVCDGLVDSIIMSVVLDNAMLISQKPTAKEEGTYTRVRRKREDYSWSDDAHELQDVA